MPEIGWNTSSTDQAVRRSSWPTVRTMHEERDQRSGPAPGGRHAVMLTQVVLVNLDDEDAIDNVVQRARSLGSAFDVVIDLEAGGESGLARPGSGW